MNKYVSEEFVKEYFIDKYPNAKSQNAKIESADVVLFRGFLVFDFSVNYGGAFQGYTSPVLTGNTKDGWSDIGAGNFITQILELLGEYNDNEQIKTSSLEGKPCRVFSDHNGIYAIGNFLKDEWFIPTYYFEQLKKDE